MTRKVILGSPTGYTFLLPQIRYSAAKSFYPGSTGTLLDYGCGNGANTVLFARDFRSVVGVDVETGRLDEAKAHLKTHPLPNLSYQKYSGVKLPFADDYFDCAVSFEVLEHTLDDAAASRDIFRVLKPGGRAIITVPNKWYLMETHGLNLPFNRVIPWNRIPFMSWLPPAIHSRYANARIYTKEAIVNLLLGQGFTLVHHHYLMPPFDKVRRPRLQSWLRSLYARIEGSPLRFMGVAHFLVVGKPL